MNIKKFFTSAALAAALSVSTLTVPAFADDRYKTVEELAGTEFVQFFAMQDYVQNCPSECPEDMDTDVYDYVKSAEGVYAIEGVAAEEINSVLVTPTYCRTIFRYDGIDMELFYYFDEAAGKTQLEYAKSGVVKETVNDYTVYYYRDPMGGENQVWKQDGKYFRLLVDSIDDDENFSYCTAKFIPFGGCTLETVDGKLYCKNPDGTRATGWQTVGGNLYYFKKSGEAVTKNRTIGGIRYKFGAGGVCQGTYTGWTKSKGNRYYYKDGIKQTGWVKFAKGWRYFSDSGVMATGDVTLPDGEVYHFSSGGIWDGKTPGTVSTDGAYSKLEKALSGNSAYAGLYIDGSMVVVMAADVESVQKTVDEVCRSSAVTVKQCRFSGAELEEVRSFLEEHMTEYGIVGLGTYIKYNRVGIDLPADEPNAALQAYLDSLPDKDIVAVATGVHIVPTDG